MEIDDLIARHERESEKAWFDENGPVDDEFALRQIQELIGFARYMELKRNEAFELLNSLLKEDESLNMLRELSNYLKERFPHSRDAPGHSHVVDGRWDNDGSECAYCSLWKRINQKLSNTGRDARREGGKDNG